MTRRRPVALMLGMAVLLGAAARAGMPAFTPIQRDLFALPGSLSNSWGDFDNDGDLDLAVSLKSGEIRLYRNDAGVLVSIGAAMGLPTKGGEFRGVSWGDYIGDGWIDLFAGATVATDNSALFRNDGGKGF